MDALRTQADYEMKHTLGRCRLIAGIGRGGMATVHLAVMNGPGHFNKLVVVKQIHAQYASDPEALAMFLAEARLTARLRHPNLTQTNEYWQDGDRHCIAMEFLDGQPLNRILHRLGDGGGLPLAMSLRVISDVLAGLHYAHELHDYDGHPLNVVHRDVTPQNIFVTYDGIVKVVDFGIAKAADSSVHTGFGIIKGKVAYMAPEQARADPVDRRADVFAVGVMLWEAVTGARPWQGLSELTIVRRLHSGQFPSARAFNPNLPPALEAILLKALAHDRGARYATARELQEDIEAYLEATGQHPTARELGTLVSTHFEAERAAMKALIEDHLRSDESPAPALAQQPPAEDRPTMPSTKKCDRRRAPLQRDFSDAKKPLVSSAAFATTVSNEIEKKPRLGRALAVAAVLAGGAVISALAFSLGGMPRRAEALTAVATAGAAPKAAATVELRISASPKEARFFLDDAPLAENPFTGRFPRDQAPHSVRIEAPGFVSRTERLTFDKDEIVDVALAGEPAQLTKASTSNADAPRSYPIRFQGRERRLDSRNPYARP